MGIFGNDSKVDPNVNSQSRNRRNSSSSAPVSIVPAPPQGGHSAGPFLKPTSTGNVNTSNVFGRQQSWSDQLADSTLLKGGNNVKIPSMPGSYPPVIPVSHNANILYANGNISNSNSNSGPTDVKFVHSTMEILENQIKREEAPKKKRTRTSTEQLRILQKAFQTDPMPNSSARMALSKKLGMSTRAVQVWFQNRRAKEKLDAKRNIMGLSGSSSFTYIKGNSDDEDEGSGAGEDDGEFNFDEEGSVSGGNESSSTISAGNKPSEFMNSMKANGMMGRMAFGDSNVSSGGLMKSQRSSSTPNGFFLGSSSGNNFLSNNSSFNGQVNSNNNNNRFPISTNKQQLTSNFGLNGNNPLCHLFPGETFISDVNEASVDQLYQDLGGADCIPSPIDDTCAVLSGGGSNHPNMNISAFMSSTNQLQPNSSSSNSSSSFFTFGDPFYGGGIIDRTPSVSPVGFGPRSHFYPIGSAFDFINMSSTTPNATPPELMDNSSVFPPVSSANACKGLSGGNVYLTSSIGTTLTSSNSSNSNRRSFSLPEAHGNLTMQQMHQLEHFGLQVFPSPLLSINEEDGQQKDENLDNSNVNNTNTVNVNNNVNNLSVNSNNSTSSNDFMIPFSDFLEGEVMR